MDVKTVLEGSGLSEGEIKVYLALLKLGSVPVSKIKEESNLHRTTIYDFLEKLLNKGLVNYVVKNNAKYYNATHPNKLLDFVKEKEENIKSILPALTKLMQLGKEELSVEVHKGVEGFKTHLNTVLKERKDLIGFGIDETKYKEKFPFIMEQFFKKQEKSGVKERILTSEKPKFIYKTKVITYRYIPKEYFNPTSTLVYGDRVALLIWEPLTVIMIKNKELADSYRKQFELLWKIAKK